MKRHAQKIIAPVIIAAGIIMYYIAGAIILITLNVSDIIKTIALICSIAMTVVIIAVLIERIKEIKKGEEDDISKY